MSECVQTQIITALVTCFATFITTSAATYLAALAILKHRKGKD